MKIKLFFLVFVIFADLLNPVDSINAKDVFTSKHFACKLVTKEGKTYQTLLLRTDWKEIVNTSQWGLNSSDIDQKTAIHSNIKVTVLLNDNDLKIKINSSEQRYTYITIHNIYGSLLFKWKVSLNLGENVILKDIKGLPKGVYFLNVSDSDNRMVTAKFIH